MHHEARSGCTFKPAYASAGLPLEAMIEYVRLFQEGEETIPARLQLLIDQREALMEQRRQIDATLNRLAYKIECYEEAVQTGVLRWGTGVDCNLICITKYAEAVQPAE